MNETAESIKQFFTQIKSSKPVTQLVIRKSIYLPGKIELLLRNFDIPLLISAIAPSIIEFTSGSCSKLFPNADT